MKDKLNLAFLTLFGILYFSDEQTQHYYILSYTAQKNQTKL